MEDRTALEAPEAKRTTLTAGECQRYPLPVFAPQRKGFHARRAKKESNINNFKLKTQQNEKIFKNFGCSIDHCCNNRNLHGWLQERTSHQVDR